MRSASKRLRLAPVSRCASIRAILLGASVVESALRGRLFTSVGSPFFISAFPAQPGFNSGGVVQNDLPALERLRESRLLAPAVQGHDADLEIFSGLLWAGKGCGL